MSIKEEGHLHDIIAAGVIGFGIGTAIAASGVLGGLESILSLGSYFGVDWGRAAAQNVVSGIFGFIPGGFIAGYLNFRLHKTQGKMEALGAGLVAAIAHFLITLFTTIFRTAILGNTDWGTVMGLWALSFVFALIFYPIGGFLSGMLEEKTFPIPSLLKLQFGAAAPPPPAPPGAQVCPTCGGPLTYIQQYQRWYCNKCKKYA